MSDVYEVVILDELLELVFDDALELVFTDDSTEVIVDEVLEVVIDEEVFEILLDSEPGIPAGGSTGQMLAKKSATHFDVEWVSVTKITVGPSAPISPNVGDLWVDTN